MIIRINTFKVPSSPDDATLLFNTPESGTGSNYDDVSCTMRLNYPQQSTSVEGLRFSIKKSPSQKFRYAIRPNKGILHPGEGVDVNILLSEKDKRALFGPCLEDKSNLLRVRQQMAESIDVTWETTDGGKVTYNPAMEMISSSALAHDNATNLIINLKHPDTDPSSSTNCIAFRILTSTDSRNYIIHPVLGIMKPGSHQSIQITPIEKDRRSVLDPFQQEGFSLNNFINDKLAILSQPVSDKSFARKIINQVSKHEAIKYVDSASCDAKRTQEDLFKAFMMGWNAMAKSYPRGVSRNRIDMRVDLHPSDRCPMEGYPFTDIVLASSCQEEVIGVRKRVRKTRRRVGRPYNKVR